MISQVHLKHKNTDISSRVICVYIQRNNAIVDVVVCCNVSAAVIVVIVAVSYY